MKDLRIRSIEFFWIFDGTPNQSIIRDPDPANFVSMTDSIYILKADYYNTVGMNVRQYLKDPIFLKPLETVEIIIEDRDMEGGSGANFIFDWAMKNDKNPPLFEAVMISPYDQHGLAFSTRGLRIFD